MGKTGRDGRTGPDARAGADGADGADGRAGVGRAQGERGGVPAEDRLTCGHKGGGNLTGL
jgi:hypothetical protein